MTSLEAIEEAVVALPPSDLARFREWFAEFDADAWDRQLDHDAALGRLDRLAKEALEDFHSGPPRDL
jgi:hypothetical protein